jgi:hypothetical protein
MTLLNQRLFETSQYSGYIVEIGVPLLETISGVSLRVGIELQPHQTESIHDQMTSELF